MIKDEARKSHMVTLVYQREVERVSPLVCRAVAVPSGSF